MPVDLKEHTEIERFEEIDSDWRLADDEGPSRMELTRLCVNDSPTDRENLVRFLLGSLKGCGSSVPWALDAVVDFLVAQDQAAPYRLREAAPPDHWDGLLVLISQINGLSLLLEGGFCYYRFVDRQSGSVDSGNVARVGGEMFTRFVRRVMDQKPLTFDAFWDCLP